MQIYSDGKNRVIKGSFPKRFKLKNAGVDVPFLRTAKDSIRLSGEIPVGNLDIEEVINEMTPTPAKLETPSFAIINRSDFDKIDILNKKLAINQSQMNAHLSALTEHEATLANLETQNAKAIDETKSIITEVAKAVGKEIQADRESLIKVSESFTSSLNETGKILSNKIDTHEKAKNPHKITKATIGLDRVDNTSDEDKPISKAVKKVLDEKADKTEIEDVKKDLKEAVKKQDRIAKGLDRMNIIGGVSGNELPSGGKKGQVLSKSSNKTGDYTWVDPVSGLKIVRVNALPVSGETGTLYLVPSNNTETSNIYDEYIWADNGTGSYSWEKIGSTEVDLSGYVKSVNNETPDENGNVALPDPLPSQSGQSGKFLTTDGTDASWANVDALPSQSGQSGKYLTTDGTSASWGTIAIPTVNNSTITLTQGGVTKGSFTLNQSSAQTIDLDAGGGSSYTAGTGIDITSNTISVTSPTLVNTATAQSALTLLGNANTNYGSSVNIGNGSTVGSLTSVAIGYNARIDVGSGGGAIAIGQHSHVWGQSSNYNCIAIGASAEAQYCTYGLALGVYSFVGSNYATAIGYYARAQHQYAIQLGQGTNSEAKTLYVGFNNTNYKLLDGTTGKIPDGRLPIATSVSSSSTNAEVVGAKLFYDTCGDIVTLINAL